MIHCNGVNHLALATGDMDRTIRFWRDLLAFFEWSAVPKPTPRSEYREYPGAGSELFHGKQQKREEKPE